MAIKQAPEKPEKFHKDTFDKTTEARRQTVLSVALQQFATKGYSATNINDIAKQAHISIGALYSYFASKEDLFLTIVNNAYDLMTEILYDVAKNSTDVYDYVARMLHACSEFATRYELLNQLYLDITTQALSPLAVRLSDQIEEITPSILGDLLRSGKQSGIVRADVDERVFAYCIDNIFMMYQFSFSSNYYKERLNIYLGAAPAKGDMTAVEAGILAFIRAALS